MKNERSEYISMYVTPEVKKEFELVKDDAKLREDVIRRYFKSEIGFVESEIAEIDEANIRYRAKLLEIRDNFKKSAVEHEKCIDAFYQTALDKLKPIQDLLSNIDKDIESVSKKATAIGEKISYSHANGLERLMEAIVKYNHFNKEQKELIRLILSKK